ncbi:thioesterase [Fructilactobacillus vespulae]|uniref:acyl-[acyl-carrier-protein] thioesterase n=1 Tax=Fructilactobacillus vespulae TaxID=1249630 RepID=UPI0039B5FACC
MAGSIFSEKTQIANYETNLHGNITLNSLLNKIVQASEDQSNSLGLGTKVVQEDGVTWVVIQYDVDITRLPRAGEKIQAQTQGTFYTKNFANRRFWLRDEENQELVSVNSLWVMMDLKARKMVPISPEAVDGYGSEKVKRIERMHKIAKIKDDDVLAMDFPVCFTNIDFNGHVTNTKYIDWMTNTLPFDFLKSHLPTNFKIKFEDEVRFGDDVTSQVKIIDDTKTIHQILVNGKAKSIAEVNWKKI